MKWFAMSLLEVTLFPWESERECIVANVSLDWRALAKSLPNSFSVFIKYFLGEYIVMLNSFI